MFFWSQIQDLMRDFILFHRTHVQRRRDCLYSILRDFLRSRLLFTNTQF